MSIDMQVLGTIGGEIPETEMKVVDRDTGNVVAPGIKGSVKVRGPQIMKGYYKVFFFTCVQCSSVGHGVQNMCQENVSFPSRESDLGM